MADFEATPAQLERMVLLMLLGIVDAYEKGFLSEFDASQILIAPTAIESLSDAGVSDESCAILEAALELEDVKIVVDQATYEAKVEDVRRLALERLAALDPMPIGPRWFCAQQDRLAFESEGVSIPDTGMEILLSAEMRDGERVERTLSTAEYFDLLEEGEHFYDCDSTPLHIDPVDYVEASSAEVRWLRIAIDNFANGRRRVLEIWYWGEDEEHHTSLVTDYLGRHLVDWERVVSVQERGRHAFHILRQEATADPVTRASVPSHCRFVHRDGNEEFEDLLQPDSVVSRNLETDV